MKTIGEIQIEQNLAQQKREWRFERIGWVVMLIILLAALLGLFGGGILSKKSIGDSSSGLQIEYNNIERYRSPVVINFIINGIEFNDNSINLFISKNYLERMDIQRVLPEPEKIEIDGDFYKYIFAAIDAKPNTLITFEVEPDRIGIANAVFKLNNVQYDITQVILP